MRREKVSEFKLKRLTTLNYNVLALREREKKTPNASCNMNECSTKREWAEKKTGERTADKKKTQETREAKVARIGTVYPLCIFMHLLVRVNIFTINRTNRAKARERIPLISNVQSVKIVKIKISIHSQRAYKYKHTHTHCSPCKTLIAYAFFCTAFHRRRRFNAENQFISIR